VAEPVSPPAGQSEESFRFHYPAIEQLVDSEDFDAINQNYTQAYERLETISKQNGMGRAREAKKAMKALERVMDLLKHLLRLKYEYLETQGLTQKEGKKSNQTQGA